jgi:hypothetical protein
MNRIIAKVVDFFWELDNTQSKKFLLGTSFGIFALFVLLLYAQFNAITRLRNEMSMINNNRMRINDMLQKNAILKKHKEHVEEIIALDKTFKLKEYIEKLVEKLDLNKQFKRADPSTKDIENLKEQGYSEIYMEAEFINMNMKQLTNLLNELESKDRIDLKRVDIIKAPKKNTIDVQLIITTLQHKIESPEETL